ncbi:cytochrome P450 [Streptomyces sp. Je 1-369]|uniref:cytochrome P450 n=1 Tax=Streptomyces sp. Je 1-369 TaxID=2966192 RepID=UPI0022858880|nr:cytochrome P450 [Streptomyces sp. Je 1-369]WAL99446.1 cytochrome P450 [Streptomyces sp. Je 1-369]
MARLADDKGARQRRGAAAYRHDPLRFLAAEFEGTRDVWRSASGRLCVAGPQVARDVLGNRQGAFRETSDFFHTRTGVFGPRAAQIAIGRAARDLVRRHLDAHRADLPRLVGTRLAPTSTWPDAGNLLIREHLRDVLLCPDSPAELHAVVDGIIARAVLAGAREHHAVLSRLRFRHRAMSALGREVQARRSARAAEPRDLLDVAVIGGGPAADPGQVAEVYLSFLFATVGSIGFALGWAVQLTGTHPDTAGNEPAWIVREALRLWPVAWLFARTPSRAHTLAGITADPRDEVNVCLYLVHRHPQHWERPDEFVPRRWAAPPRDAAYMPFGFGPHTCAGATVTMTLLEDLIRIITRDWHLSITASGSGPQLGPALAPPRFTAELHHRAAAPERR